MSLTVVELHNAGIALCDIKHANTLLSQELDPDRLFLADFGVSVKNKAYVGGSTEYTPPEAFSLDYRDTPYTEVTTGGFQVVNQFDDSVWALLSVDKNSG